MMQVVPAGCSPRVSTSRIYTARQSPFLAPLTAIGPHCGFKKGKFSFAVGLSLSLVSTPPKASSVSTTTIPPGSIDKVGFA
jgi:hypothetical protein